MYEVLRYRYKRVKDSTYTLIYILTLYINIVIIHTIFMVHIIDI